MLFGLPLSPGHEVAATPEQLSRMVAAMRSSPERGLDFETNGLRYADGDRPIGVSLGFMDGDRPRCWYVPFAHRTAETQANPTHAKQATIDALAGAEAVIGFNLKFELHMARAWAGDGALIPDSAQLHDAQVQAHLAYENRASFSLEGCAQDEKATLWGDAFAAKRLLSDFLRDRAKQYKLPLKKDKVGCWSYLSRFGHSEVPVAIEAEYACRDVAHSLLLDRALRAKAQGCGMGHREAARRALYANEMMLVRALHDMEYSGQRCDAQYLNSLAVWLDGEIERRSSALARVLGVRIDWANDNALRELIYDYWGHPVTRRTARGLPSVDQTALQDLLPERPALADLIELRVRIKVRSTYTDSLAWLVCEDGRLHPSFLQVGTRTGRFSSRSPNFQNVPVRHKQMARLVRQAFPVDDGGVRLLADYSQVELRMLEFITGAPSLTKAYASPAYCAFLRGELGYDGYVVAREREPAADVHGAVAGDVFGVFPGDPDYDRKRRASKAINFGIPYGGGEEMLTGNSELRLSREEARNYLAAYHRANPAIKLTQAALFDKMLTTKTTSFTNWAGRSRHGGRLRSSDSDIRAEEQRAMFASLVQGSAAELTRFSVVRLYMLQKQGLLPATSTSTVHDEIQLDCAIADLPEVARTVRQQMEWFPFFGDTPIVVDLETTVTTWADKQRYEAQEVTT